MGTPFRPSGPSPAPPPPLPEPCAASPPPPRGSAPPDAVPRPPPLRGAPGRGRPGGSFRPGGVGVGRESLQKENVVFQHPPRRFHVNWGEGKGHGLDSNLHVWIERVKRGGVAPSTFAGMSAI